MKEFIIGILIIIAIVVFWRFREKSTNNEDKVSNEQIETNNEQIEIDDEWFENLIYRKEAILISHKYKIEEEKVFNILVKWNNEEKNYEFARFDKEADSVFNCIDEDTDSLRKLLKGLSEKHYLPLDVVASIIIDYEMMRYYEE